MKLMRYVLLSLVYLAASGISHASIPEIVISQKNAVVTIYTENNGNIIASGSGFIIDTKGIVVTNNHVIESWNKSKSAILYVKKSDGSFLTPDKIIIADEVVDIAILQVKETDLPFIKMAYDYVPKQGDEVVVIGSPLGFESTISNGIISAIRGDDGYLQITSPISKGSSGSPVLNMRGDAIGVAALIMMSGQNLNFAIPSKYVNKSLSGSNKELVKSETMLKLEKGLVKLQTIATPEFQRQLPKISEGCRRGTIISTFASAGYSYIKYSDNVSVSWVAAMQKDFKDGDIIDFSDSEPIVNFTSESLNMTFKAIIFANEIRIIDRDRKYFVSSKYYYEFLRNQLNLQDYDGAYSLYTQAIIESPNYADFYYQRAMEFYLVLPPAPSFDTSIRKEQERIKNMKCQDMLNDLNSAIKYERNSDVYFSERARILSTTCNFDRFDDALSDYDIAIKLNPNMQKYYIAKAEIYLKTSNLAKAYECAKKASSIDKNNRVLNIFYTTYYITTSDTLMAIFHYKKFVLATKQILKSPSTAYNSAAITINSILDRNGKFADGVKFYNEIIKVDPYTKIYYSSRARYKIKLNRHKDALYDYSKLIEMEPEISYNYYLRAEAYVAVGNKLKAMYDFNTACAMGDVDACPKAAELLTDLDRGDKWIYFGESKKMKAFYDKTSIEKKANSYTVWVRYEQTADSVKNDMIKNGYDNNTISSYDKYSHSLAKFFILCHTRKIGTLDYIDYDTSGSIIKTNKAADIEMESLIPDSLGDALVKYICK